MELNPRSSRLNTDHFLVSPLVLKLRWSEPKRPHENQQRAQRRLEMSSLYTFQLLGFSGPALPEGTSQQSCYTVYTYKRKSKTSNTTFAANDFVSNILSLEAAN